MRSCGQRSDLDGVAQVMKSRDEPLGLCSFGTLVEMVVTKVVIAGTVFEHVVYGGKDRSGDGADGFFGTTPGTDSVELGLEIAALLAHSGPAALDQGCLEPRGALRMRVDRRFPALSSFLGHRPAHEIRCAAVGNRPMSVPISAAIICA